MPHPHDVVPRRAPAESHSPQWRDYATMPIPRCRSTTLRAADPTCMGRSGHLTGPRDCLMRDGDPSSLRGGTPRCAALPYFLNNARNRSSYC
jgi:hypothetical protein